MTGGRRCRADEIPQELFAVVGANIRILRQRRGWTQGQLGELMGWPTIATVCAAEGHRSGRQRAFAGAEVNRLTAIFGVSSQQLTTQCVNCRGNPPAGLACLTCGARNWQPGPPADAVRDLVLEPQGLGLGDLLSPATTCGFAIVTRSLPDLRGPLVIGRPISRLVSPGVPQQHVPVRGPILTA